tara:strand:- start:1781 stop:3334 length:1554 start_codon:yes stop_codon:yes gene_type:complete
MSSAKSYKLSKIDVLIGDKKVDIRELVSEFNWFESIDSSFIRCDFTILDTVQFDDNLLGSEIVHITFESTTEKKSRIQHTLQIYKIGSIVKQERAKLYILHCSSPEIYENEANRAFGQFGPVSGKTDIVKRMVKDHLNSSKKTHIEAHTNINVLSPNWRPVDLISYMSDKVSRTKAGSRQSGKGKKQSGFLFYENRDGWNFKSMDLLCEQESIAKYTYAQANVGQYNPGTNFYQIEQVIYPERANQLDKLRQGVYKQCTYGIVMAQLTDSYMPNAGATSSTTFDEWVKLNKPYTANDGSAGSLSNEQLQELYNSSGDSTFNNAGNDTSFTWKPKSQGSKDNLTEKQLANKDKTGKPSGTISGPMVSNLKQTFAKASKLHDGLPYREEHLDFYTDLYPTRTKFKILPGFNNQTANAPKGGADDADESVLTAATYSAARWSLLNTHTLTIRVPGNTKLYAGCVVTVNLPSSKQESKKNVARDQTYSGKYLVKGLRHTYKKQGITTELYLCRGSLPVTKN